MAKQARKAAVKGYKGERAGTVREKARKVADKAVKSGKERPTVISAMVKQVKIAPTTASNWYSRWHGESRA